MDYNQNAPGTLVMHVLEGMRLTSMNQQLRSELLSMHEEDQRGGTQHDIDHSGIVFPLPIEEQEKVEALRKEVGLDPLSVATGRIQERHRSTAGTRKRNGS